MSAQSGYNPRSTKVRLHSKNFKDHRILTNWPLTSYGFAGTLDSAWGSWVIGDLFGLKLLLIVLYITSGLIQDNGSLGLQPSLYAGLRKVSLLPRRFQKPRKGRQNNSWLPTFLNARARKKRLCNRCLKAPNNLPMPVQRTKAHGSHTLGTRAKTPGLALETRLTEHA